MLNSLIETALRNRFLVIAGTLLFAIALVGCGRKDTPGEPVPEQLTLYSIDGTAMPHPGDPPPAPEGETFSGYKVLGKLEVVDPAKRQELLKALNDGIARSDGSRGFCFLPRHAIRLVRQGKTIDYVICFECLWVYIYQDRAEKKVTVDRSPQPIFDKFLTDAGITLAPPAR